MWNGLCYQRRPFSFGPGRIVAYSPIVAIGKTKIPGALATIPIAALAVSWAAIFIRFADAPPFVIAFYRMASATIILTLWAIGPGRGALTQLTIFSFRHCLLSGLFLAFHFALWITSLGYTPVANSVMLVATAPIFAAVLGHFLLKEKPQPWAYAAILLAIGGGALIMGGDVHWAPGQLVGDLLALAGAVMASAYFLMGRMIQRTTPVFAYIYTTYAAAACFLGIIVLIAGDRFVGYPPMTWLWFLMLGLVPTVIGHSLYNRALRYFKAHVVGAAVLAEPVGATFLAYLILHEIPPWYAMLGALPIFVGVAWVFWLERNG